METSTLWCLSCGITLEHGSKRSFCSLSCAGYFNGKVRVTRLFQEYKESPKKCPFCRLPIPYSKKQNKYCSHGCAASYNNKGVVRNGKPRKRGEGKCLHCGTLLVEHQLKYCSRGCVGAHKQKRYWEKAEKAGSFPQNAKYGTIKEYLYIEYGRVCSICGFNKWNGVPIPLELDHIDGDSTNNSLDNLRAICGNCAMLLPTYKGGNLGKGRYSRRKRYAEGKSY